MHETTLLLIVNGQTGEISQSEIMVFDGSFTIDQSLPDAADREMVITLGIETDDEQRFTISQVHLQCVDLANRRLAIVIEPISLRRREMETLRTWLDWHFGWEVWCRIPPSVRSMLGDPEELTTLTAYTNAHPELAYGTLASALNTGRIPVVLSGPRRFYPSSVNRARTNDAMRI